jgi:hypothetical protein
MAKYEQPTIELLKMVEDVLAESLTGTDPFGEDKEWEVQ